MGLEDTTLSLWVVPTQARQARLLIRFRAVDANLEVCAGTLGMPRLKSGSASKDIANATLVALQKFCTQTGFLDKGLQRHIQQHTRILTTDAASSELLASAMLRGRRGLERPLCPHFKNVVLIGRDNAHASMRLLKRPWYVIEEIQELISKTVTSSEAPCQKLFHSDTYSLWFGEMTAAEKNSPKVSSLSAAKHRFASFQRPLSRVILHLRSFIGVLHKIVALKSETDCKWASKWMSYIDGRRLLLLALAADAADTLVELTRFFDSESTDPAVQNREVALFVQKVEYQFGAGNVFNITGYAKHCWEALTGVSPLYVLNNGQQRKLKVGAADKAWAVEAMKPWVALCKEGCQAEFPDFHLFMSMRVLDLHAGGCPAEEKVRCLRRLAKGLGLDEHQLLAEYELLQPVAMAFHRTHNDRSTREAWKEAYVRTQNTSALRNKYSVNELRGLLQAHASWTMSTSGIEQNFSKAERTQGARRFGPKCESTEFRSMVVLAFEESSSVKLDDVLCQARKLYARHVSRHLGSYKRKRLDRGIKRQRPAGTSQKTEVAWIARRRQSLAEAVKTFHQGVHRGDDDCMQHAKVAKDTLANLLSISFCLWRFVDSRYFGLFVAFC